MTSKHKHEEKEKHAEEALVPEPEMQETTPPEYVEEASSGHSGEDPAVKAARELTELNDKYLRLYSEFDNYRKRTMRERAEWTRNAHAEVISSVLPVLDDLERALKAFGSPEATRDSLKEGVSLIYNKALAILAQNGLEPIDAKEKEFNTDFHEAVTHVPAPTPELRGKVVDEIQKGYTLDGKVIRFAKVVVGS
jgi:molecular chaperone GrpE